MNEYLENIKCTGNPDMSYEARRSYVEDYSDFMKDSYECVENFRGDTLCSFGWTFGGLNKTSIKFNPKLRSYGRLFNEEEIEIIEEFRLNYHCKANFAVLPYKLNIWRGAFKEGTNDNWGNGQCDYPDIFLGLIRSYYLGINIPEIARKHILEYADWLDWFGRGEDGWQHFVNYYKFIPYVNEAYEVKDLFAMPNVYQKKDCAELVGLHHGWDYCLPLCSIEGRNVDLQTGKQRALNFAKNSLWIWEERSKLLIAHKSA